MTEEKRLKIKWKDFPYDEPIRIIIVDWCNLRRFYQFMVVDAIMEYKGREIELCVPYKVFVLSLMSLPVWQQRLIRDGQAVIELMKTYKRFNHGIVIRNVEKRKL